jgi:HD-GYP domain-containing protein (c-di-GMP phosphodiesterase class II)
VPLLTRIVSVVDVFDALVSRRPYKEAWTVADASANIEAASGTQFDPTVVAAFLKLLRQNAFADLLATVHADNQAEVGH